MGTPRALLAANSPTGCFLGLIEESEQQRADFDNKLKRLVGARDLKGICRMVLIEYWVAMEAQLNERKR